MKANINFFREIGGVGKMKDNAFFIKGQKTMTKNILLKLLKT